MPEQPTDTRLETRPPKAARVSAPPAPARQMTRWRLWLFTWLAGCEAPEALALGLPADRVVTGEQVVETE